MNFFKQIGSYLTLFKKGRIGNVEPGVEPNDVVVKSQLDAIGGKKVYKAIMSQSGTDAPAAIVLINTLGVDITWSYGGVGTYYGTAGSAVFTNGKTWFFAGNQADLSTQTTTNTTSQVQLLTLSDVATASNNMMFTLAVLIEVYD